MKDTIAVHPESAELLTISPRDVHEVRPAVILFTGRRFRLDCRKLRSGRLAHGTFIGRRISLVNILADQAFPFFHRFVLSFVILSHLPSKYFLRKCGRGFFRGVVQR